MTGFDIEQYWNEQTQSHIKTANKTAISSLSEFKNIIKTCTKAIKLGNKILFFGNGGSASDAQHLATELTVRFINNRSPIAAIALTTDTSALTATGNDFGFEHIFSRQIDAIGKNGDIAIALSTSGNSPNIIKALEMARSKNIVTIGFSGRDGGRMKELCDQIIIVPSDITARIQEMHILLGHMLCGGLEQNLGLSA